MAKRMQEQKKGEERVVVESKIYSDELVFNCSDKFLICNKSECIQTSGTLTATEKLESRMRRNSKSDAASSSQVRLQDAYLGWLMDKAAGKVVATEEESGDVDLSESETWNFQEDATAAKPIACKIVVAKPCASSKSDCQESPKAERKVWPHLLHISPATAHHTEAVVSIVRELYGRGHG